MLASVRSIWQSQRCWPGWWVVLSCLPLNAALAFAEDVAIWHLPKVEAAIALVKLATAKLSAKLMRYQVFIGAAMTITTVCVRCECDL